MSETLRALVVVLGLGLPVIMWTESALIGANPSRRNLAQPAFWVLWLLVTVLEFLLPSFPLFLVMAGVAVLLRSRNEPVPMALCLALLTAVPEVSVDLPTFGIVEHLLPINFTLTLSVVLLFPLLLTVSHHDARPPRSVGRAWTIAYVGWLAFINGLSGNFTGFLRFLLSTILSIYVPFAAGLKSLNSFDGLHRLLAIYVAATAAAALVGIFEYLKSWLLFAGLPPHWGITFGLLHYLARGTALRAQAASGQPIFLGFLISIALVLALSPALYRGKPGRRLPLVALLSVGLFATVSRGPWLAAIAGTGVYLSLERGGLRRVAKFAAGGGLALMVAALLPGGEKLIDLLPWIGKADTGSTSYRADLFSAIVPLLIDSPVFGLPDYDTRPELQFLRQGEGLIDLVNSYIAVGVSSGIVGLVAFLGALIRTLLGLRRAHRSLSGERRELVRAFLAAYATMLFVLATTSTSGNMGFLVWAFVGLGSGIAVLAQVAEPAPIPARSRAGGTAARRRIDRMAH